MRGALSIEPPLAGSVVTVGTFDGVHRGHQELVRRAGVASARVGRPVVAYTFDPHPASLFAPSPPKTLMPLDRRVEALLAAGAGSVLVENFDGELADVDAEDWVDRYLVRPLRPQHVVVGFNFTFGRGRKGTAAGLVPLGAKYGFGVEVVDAIEVEGVVVSSTQIRRVVSEGRMEMAALLLGRPFQVVGRVRQGDQRGRTIGFPTANVDPEQKQLPCPGVYAGWLQVLDGPKAGIRWPAVTNVGSRPTFKTEADVTVESHVLDQTLDLYGSRVEVEFLVRLRGERAFSGPEALRAQIAADVALAREELEGP